MKMITIEETITIEGIIDEIQIDDLDEVHYE
jgi:hypothetical protein